MEHKNKSRILYVYKLLCEKSDEQNPITVTMLLAYLTELGLTAHRRTVVTDIEQLEEFGIDIITIKSTQNRYYIGSRKFELPEVKLLVDAVESSRFITSKKSTDLVKKLSSLVSENQAVELNRDIFIDKRIKPQNEEIYYTVDALHCAISTQKQVDFKYYDYNSEKEKILKNNGALYKISPYALVWNDDNYYVVGYSKKHSKISKFRIDRMTKVQISDSNAVPMPNGFNGSDYAKNMFNMYDGETKTVELKCTNHLMKVIIDKFGEDVETIALGSNCFKAIVDVSVSPTFFGWVFQFCGDMSILVPVEVKNAYAGMLKKAMDM